MTSLLPAGSLTAERAEQAIYAAGQHIGLNTTDARLIRLGSNAVFSLPGEVIARVSCGSDAVEGAQRQVAVARWLEDSQYPATRALPVPQPVQASGFVVTFWHSVAPDTQFATLGQVGSLIRQFHQLDPPKQLILPRHEPFRENRRRFDALAVLVEEKEYRDLAERVDGLEARYSCLTFPLGEGVIHGDANIGNVILDRDGAPIVIDLDNVSIGPREWDLIKTAAYFERFGWHSKADYRRYCDAYGVDILDWSGYSVLADLVELFMTLWLSLKAQNDRDSLVEVRKRVRAITSDASRLDWSPY